MLVTYQNYTKMHGQKNIKYSILLHSCKWRGIVSLVLRSKPSDFLYFFRKRGDVKDCKFLGPQHLTQTSHCLHFKHQSEGHVGRYIGVCYYCTQIAMCWQILVTSLKYEISRKFVQWESRSYMPIEGRADMAILFLFAVWRRIKQTCLIYYDVIN
jgi:hypothetical protein